MDRTFKSVIDRQDSHLESLRELERSALSVRRIRHSAKARCIVSGTCDYMIAMRLGGSSDITRYDGNRVDGHRPAIGGVCISGSEHEHGWLFPGPTEAFHMYVNRNALEDMVETEFDADCRTLMIEPVFDSHDPFMHQLAVTADQALRFATPADRLLLDQLNTTLYGYFLKQYSNFGRPARSSQSAASSEDIRIRRVLEFIEENLGAVIGIENLVEISAMSASSLMRSFKKATGKSAAAYVKERRLQVAEEMLSRTRKPLGQIAFETGFCDHAHFTRSFKARFSITPSKWRR